ASIAAHSYSYLSENVVAVHGVLSILCLVFFLLAIAVSVLMNTDGSGKIHSPQSLPALLCLLLLIPHGGLAIGVMVNYQSSVEIMLAVQDAQGVNVYLDQGFLVLDGDIGEHTLASLES